MKDYKNLRSPSDLTLWDMAALPVKVALLLAGIAGLILLFIILPWAWAVALGGG
jgi:hypothetical protein